MTTTTKTADGGGGIASWLHNVVRLRVRYQHLSSNCAFPDAAECTTRLNRTVWNSAFPFSSSFFFVWEFPARVTNWHVPRLVVTLIFRRLPVCVFSSRLSLLTQQSANPLQPPCSSSSSSTCFCLLFVQNFYAGQILPHRPPLASLASDLCVLLSCLPCASFCLVFFSQTDATSKAMIRPWNELRFFSCFSFNSGRRRCVRRDKGEENKFEKSGETWKKKQKNGSFQWACAVAFWKEEASQVDRPQTVAAAAADVL